MNQPVLPACEQCGRGLPAATPCPKHPAAGTLDLRLPEDRDWRDQILRMKADRRKRLVTWLTVAGLSAAGVQILAGIGQNFGRTIGPVQTIEVVLVYGAMLALPLWGGLSLFRWVRKRLAQPDTPEATLLAADPALEGAPTDPVRRESGAARSRQRTRAHGQYRNVQAG